jgi:energy-coupling factor transporter transmembrane protein EcfT
MEKLLIATLIGAVAGGIDVLPMALRRTSVMTLAVPFTHWIGVAILCAYVRMPIAPWAQGLCVALLTTVPVLIDYSQRKPEAVLPVFGMTLVIGAVVGWATGRFAA